VYSFQYPAKLRGDAAALPIAGRGRFWAEQVAASPPDGDRDGWAALDVEISTFERDTSYRTVLLTAVDDLAQDPVVAADFVRAIGNPPAERISADLYATVVTRTLNADFADRAARTKLADWALAQISSPEARRDAVMRALRGKGPYQRAAFAELTAGLADPSLGAAVAEEVANLEERHQRATAEAELQRAARAAQVSRQQQVESEIRRDPEGQFAIYASRAGLTLDTVGESDLSRQGELLAASRELIDKRLHGEIEVLPPLASAALVRATEQRASGTSFRGADAWSSDAAIDRYAELPALLAESPDEFWANAAELAQVRQLDPATTSRLYTAWREGLIERRLAQSAAAEAPGPQPPLGTSLRVEVPDGVVRYWSSDELIADLRSYFTPGADRAMSTPITGVSRRAAVGSSAGAALLDQVNMGYDVQNMDRIEQEIREWDSAPDVRDGPYVDVEAVGGGMPYKYGPGLFSGHGIHVGRSDEGLELRFSGGGLGPSGVSMLKDFAAFQNRSLQYEGPVELTYTITPPDDIAARPVTPSLNARPGELGQVVVPLPLDRIARHLQEISGCTDADAAALGAVLKTPRDDLTGEPMPLDAAQLTIGGYGHRFTPAAVDGEAAATVLQYDDRVTMTMPSVQVRIALPDPDRHSRLAASLLASQSRFVAPSHPAGYHRGNGQFVFHETEAQGLRRQAGNPVAAGAALRTRAAEQSTRDTR
jgi:hypothetical protein